MYGLNIFWSIISYDLKIFLVGNFFRGNFLFGNFCCSEICFWWKKFWSEKILICKNVKSEKNLNPKKFGSEKSFVHKKTLVRKNLGQKILVWKLLVNVFHLVGSNYGCIPKISFCVVRFYTAMFISKSVS